MNLCAVAYHGMIFLKLFYNYAVGCHFFMLSLMTLHGIAVSIDFEQGKIV